MTFSNLFGKQSNVFWRIFYSFIILFQDHLTAFHLPKLLGRVVYIEIWCTIWFPSRHRHMLNYPCHDPSGHLLSKSNNNNLSQRPTGQAPLAESAVYTLCHINNFCPCLHDWSNCFSLLLYPAEDYANHDGLTSSLAIQAKEVRSICKFQWFGLMCL